MIAGEAFAAEIKLNNFEKPFLNCYLNSNIDFAKLDTDFTDNRFDYIKGKLKLDLKFIGDMAYFTKPDSNERPFVEGTLTFSDATFKHKKVDFDVSKVNGTLYLENDITKMNGLKICTGKSLFELNGFCNHLLASIVSKDIPFVVDAIVSSDYVSLKDFMPKNVSPKVVKTNKKTSLGTKTQKLTKSVLNTLPQGLMLNLKGKFKKIVYRRFEAYNAETILKLNGQKLNLSQKANTLDGKLAFALKLYSNSQNQTFVNVKGNIKGINVNKLFYSCENFKQEILTHDNITGKVDIKVNMQYIIDNKTNADTNSLHSVIDFKLKNAKLNHFEPLTKMSNILLKNRDLEHVEIEDLENKITIRGTKLYVPEMTIVSNIIFFYAGGSFSFKTQELNAQCFVPLRNLKKHFKPIDSAVDAKRGLCIPVSISGKAKNISVKLANRNK